jgi:hypothetical protein
MVDGGASGCCRTSDATDLASASAELVTVVSVAGFGSGPLPTTSGSSVRAAKGAEDTEPEFDALSAAAGGEGGPGLNKVLIPSQLSSTAAAPRISSSALPLKRRRARGRGGSWGISFTRITSRLVCGVSNWDSAAGSSIADVVARCRAGKKGRDSASRRRHLSSSCGKRTNEVRQGALLSLISLARAIGYSLTSLREHPRRLCKIAGRMLPMSAPGR